MSRDKDSWYLFATDKRGYEVYCSERRLDYIYEYHPELRNFWADEGDFAKAISDAIVIYQSTHGEEFNVYYMQKPGTSRGEATELKVVVKFEGRRGELYMAQPCSKRPDGEEPIWPSMNP